MYDTDKSKELIVIELGDKIRDIEDSDCYFEGLIVYLIPLRYKIIKIIWNNEIDNSRNGEITESNWWFLEIFKNNNWIKID